MKLSAFCVSLISLSVAQAGHPAVFTQARALYYQGADGNQKAYDQADKLFSQLRRQSPDDPRIKVYYGSLRLLEASHTWAVWKKNSLSKQGIELMDSAVKGAPDDLEVRFVRAATTYELPSFFHLKQQSADDFADLARQAVEAARKGSLEPRLAAASLYYHAEFLRDQSETENARQSWKEAIALAPHSRAARDSREELKRVGGSS